MGILEEMEDRKVIGLIETIIKKLLFLLRVCLLYTDSECIINYRFSMLSPAIIPGLVLLRLSVQSQSPSDRKQ